MIKGVLTFLLFGLTIFSNSALAIVNIESVRVEEPDNGLSGLVSISMDGKSGNSDKRNSDAGFKANYRQNNHLWLSMFERNYGESNDEKNENKTFWHGRYLYYISKSFAWEAFVQYEEDEFKSLTSRRLSGSNIRWATLGAKRKWASYLGLGVFYEAEKIDTDGYSFYVDESQDTVRLNLYWSFKVQLAEDVQFQNTLYFQPSMKKGNDVRALDQFSIKVKMNKHLSFKFAANLGFDGQPVTDELERDDISYKTGFEYDF